MKPVDEVDAAIGSRSAPPVFRVVNHEVSNELNPNAINILCKPPASTSSSRIHKIGELLFCLYLKSNKIIFEQMNVPSFLLSTHFQSNTTNFRRFQE